MAEKDGFYQVDHVIQLPPERMIWRGMDERGNPIMDVLQSDGTYKLMHTEVIEQWEIEGPVAFRHGADGSAELVPYDEDDDAG